MSKSFTEHPMFMGAANAANLGLQQALIEFGLEDRDLLSLSDATLNRVVDDLTRLLLRAYDLRRERKLA